MTPRFPPVESRTPPRPCLREVESRAPEIPRTGYSERARAPVPNFPDEGITFPHLENLGWQQVPRSQKEGERGTRLPAQRKRGNFYALTE